MASKKLMREYDLDYEYSPVKQAFKEIRTRPGVFLLELLFIILVFGLLIALLLMLRPDAPKGFCKGHGNHGHFKHHVTRMV